MTAHTLALVSFVLESFSPSVSPWYGVVVGASALIVTLLALRGPRASRVLTPDEVIAPGRLSVRQ